MKYTILVIVLLSLSMFSFNCTGEKKNNSQQETVKQNIESNNIRMQDENGSNKKDSLPSDSPLNYLSWEITLDNSHGYVTKTMNPIICTGRDKYYKIEFTNSHPTHDIKINEYKVKIVGFYSQSGTTTVCNTSDMELSGESYITVGRTFTTKSPLVGYEDWRIKEIKEIVINDVEWVK
jgi:hypothetical protein